VLGIATAAVVASVPAVRRLPRGADPSQATAVSQPA
jgi:hypothetical protein